MAVGTPCSDYASGSLLTRGSTCTSWGRLSHRARVGSLEATQGRVRVSGYGLTSAAPWETLKGLCLVWASLNF